MRHLLLFRCCCSVLLGGRTELSEPGNQRQSRWPGDRERMFEQLREVATRCDKAARLFS